MPSKMNISGIPQRTKQKMQCDTFLGVDFSGDDNVSLYRSPDAVNFISNGVGNIRKRTGYKSEFYNKNITGNINGVHYFARDDGSEIIILHCGAWYFINPGESSLGAGFYNANNNISHSFMYNKKLWIVDGKYFYVYDGDTFSRITDISYIPTILIGKSPAGGGTLFENINLLSDKRCESFLSDGTSTVYHLSSGKFDAIVKCERKTGGKWVNIDSVVLNYDLNAGTVTFSSPIPVSETEGEDNVRITYKKLVQENVDKILNCDICTLFGYNGVCDRLFLSGNKDFRNYDFYSEKDDFTYFKDTSYCVIGRDDSDIVGYLAIGEYLATFKNSDKDGDNTNIIMRKANMINNNIEFVVIGQYQSSPILAKNAFGYCSDEALFLSSNGINALCSSDVLGEKYAQNRSYYINNRLLCEKNLQNAFCICHDSKYYLFINSKVYILDTLQHSSNKNTPYCARQYECFYWDNIDACYAYAHGGELYFGTRDGHINKFYSNYDDINSFNDGGNPINAYYKTPLFDGFSFYNRKNISYISVRIKSFVNSSVQIKTLEEGQEIIAKKYSGEGKYLDFSYLDFNNLNFSTDKTDRTIGEKIRIKGIDKIQFTFENNKINEPLELQKYAFEYTEKGKYIK